jgi:uncharacterized membrane protein
MNRKELDAFVGHHHLTPSGVEALLDLAGARPSSAEQLRFGLRMLLLAGVLSLAAGVIFFIAANWDELRVLGRFVLLQVLFVASVGVALWSPPPRVAGRYGLLSAFILTGALLALFGQTYQTGADVYELFLSWTLLGLVLVVAGRWSVLWGAWILVLNTSLALYFGWRPQGGLFWLLFSGFDVSASLMLMVPAVVNLGLWGLCEATRGTSLESAFTQQVPVWLRRLVVACAIAFGTWAGSIAIFDRWVDDTALQGRNAETLLLHAVILAVIGFHTVRRRLDVFPLAMIAASLIVLGTLGIARFTDDDDAGTFFVLTAWLVVSSTLCSRLLLGLFRTWRHEEQPA